MCSINCLYHRCSRNISHQKRIGSKATRITGAAVKQSQSNGAGACHVLLSSDMLAHVSNSQFTQEAAQCQQQCTWCPKHAPTYRGVHAQQAPEGCRCMCIRVVTASSNPGPIALQAAVLGRRLPQHNQIAATTHDRRGPREQLHILVPCSTLPSTAKLCCCTSPCHGVLLYVTVPPRRGDLAATCAPECLELYMPTAAGSEIKNQR